MKKQANISKEHLLYLKKVRGKSLLINLLRLSVLIFIIGFWELSARLEWVNPFITSSPSRIAKTIAGLYNDGTLFFHVGTTLWETALGFVIAVALGYSIALLLWWSEIFRRVSEPYFVVLNALPKIALGPVIIIAFGSGVKSIIFMTIIVTVIVTIINMLNAYEQTEKGKILLLKSLGANKLTVLFRLVVPSSAPAFFSTLKVNVGLSWIGSIMGEYVVSKQGIGYLIVYGGQVFRLDLVMTGTVLLCLLAAAMYALVLLFERLTVKRRK